MIPRATYRLQFRKEFPFEAAVEIVPYLARLGVSHVYASPIGTARAGSPHGYDVIDPTQINPELGGEAGFRALAEALRREGLGLILDIVPNHMAVGGDDNAWWLDVLAKGEASAYAELFDIDWRGPDPTLQGKVLAPFLGAPYGDALAAGDIRLAAADGAFAAIAHGAHRFPIRGEDHAEVAERGLAAYDPASLDGRAALHELLERQHWRLAWWRAAGDIINWRRFFDITGLAGLRMETDEAFELVHRLPLRLYAEGLIDGLRVDHVDGLTDPASYCRKLRARLEDIRPGEPGYLIVEKILGRHEPLARDWEVDGTTGYDFMNEVSLLLHEPAGAEALADDWARLSGEPASFDAYERAARGELLRRSFSGQLAGAVRALHRLTSASLAGRDVTPAAIERALTSLIGAIRVYRTYATSGGLPAWNEPMLDRALDAARALQAPGEGPLLDELAARLVGGGDPSLRGEAARRLQQLTAPLAAKAVEDTAFYRYGRLLSRNDVGFDASRLGAPLAELHAIFAARAADFPNAMLTTATHDHKRGEDARARLAVLSEMPGAWSARRQRWAEMNRGLSEGMRPVDEAMLYQSLVGAWPLAAAERHDIAALQRRLSAWQEKALREAKQRSSWADPDLAYEGRCRAFLEAILEPRTGAEFTRDLAGFVDEIAPAGVLNGLAQTLLRCTAPGLPDLYQGREYWDFSLVDPDNRAPVDYRQRAKTLEPARSVAESLPEWREGRIKQALIARALQVRAAHAEVFQAGGYRPLEVTGPRAGSVFAFCRESSAGAVVVGVTIRSAAAVMGRDTPLPAAAWWAETRVDLPGGTIRAWTDAFTEAETAGGAAPIERLFAELPVALLVASRSEA
jgi:(1->4)-alpha-D-glucan 1-alpha-D-glucosylmutase